MPWMPFTQELQIPWPVKFLDRVTLSELVEEPFDLAPTSATTVSVLNLTRIKFSNTGSTTVTDLIDGQEGQLVILLGDGFTTLANNSRLALGSNTLLQSGRIYPLVYHGASWYPLPTAAPTAGAGISVSGTTVTNLYVGKSITLIGFSATLHTSTSDQYPSGLVRYNMVTDLTGMTQYRISGTVHSVVGSPSIGLQYSTDGSSWSDAGTADYSATGNGNFSTSFASLTAGARIATCWIRPYVTLSFGSDEVVISFLSVEFKP